MSCIYESTFTVSGIGHFDTLFFDVTGASTPYVLDNIKVISATPEPSSLALLSTGALGMIGFLRRRRG